MTEAPRCQTCAAWSVRPVSRTGEWGNCETCDDWRHRDATCDDWKPGVRPENASMEKAST